MKYGNDGSDAVGEFLEVCQQLVFDRACSGPGIVDSQ